ncbi:MAG: hypothetical protein KDC17_14925, partial [Actinobacteria bacterium]|nr:hypothetical protein [Actinomycetota bacterium]
VATALLAVLVVGRSVALPLVLGAVAMAVSYLLTGPDAALQAQLGAALVPAMVTILIVSVFAKLIPGRGDTMEDAAEEPEPIRVGRP